ncbi:D-amino-acid oxidase [Balamuthia mandrillaris]
MNLARRSGCSSALRTSGSSHNVRLARHHGTAFSPFRFTSVRRFSSSTPGTMPGRQGRCWPRRLLRGGLLVATAAAATAFALDVFLTDECSTDMSALASPIHEGLLDTYYSRSLRPGQLKDRPSVAPLSSSSSSPSKQSNDDINVDVCVVGGGLTGVVTALELAERGLRVAVLEQKRVGAGASGLNGGFAINGFQLEGMDLVEALGGDEDTARRMFQWTVEAQERLRRRIDQYKIDCEVQDGGFLTASFLPNAQREAEEEVQHLNKSFGTKLEVWPKEKVRQLFKSEVYHHGVFEPRTFTVNPLKLVLGLANAAEEKGASIFERSKAVSIQRQNNNPSSASTPTKEEGNSKERKYVIRTAWYDGYDPNTAKESTGRTIHADDVVLAGAAQLSSRLDWKVARSVAPVFTYILVTEPLPGGEEELQRLAMASPTLGLCDDRFALNYYRPLPGGRILWGGFAQTYPISTAKLKEDLVKDLWSIYPQLEGKVKVETAWGGTLAFALKFLPMIGRKPGEDGVWYATAFGGHGLVPTSMAAELIASAIASRGKDERWRVFQENVPLRHAGWPFARGAAQVMYWSLGLRDRWNIWRYGWKKEEEANKKEKGTA